MAHIREASKTAQRNVVSREQEFFSIRDLCQLFGCSRPTVNHWLQSGQLEFFQQNMIIRVPRASVEQFINNNLANVARKQAQLDAQVSA